MNPLLVSELQKMKALGLGPVDVMTADLGFAREALEKQYAYLNQVSIPVKEVRTRTWQFEQETVCVRLYSPLRTSVPSTFGVYLHGGGWTFGDEKTHDGIARAFCSASQLPIASIGYSLAPHKKYPYQSQQVAFLLTQLIELFQQESTTGIPVKVILIGDSAGAHLALSVYQDFLAETLQLQVIGMILYYGVFSGNTSTESWTRLGDGRYGLSTAAMHWYWNQYLHAPENKNQPEVSPLYSHKTHLPATWLLVGNLDPLLDDTLRFAEKLKAQKTPYQVQVLEGYPHGFLRFCNQLPEVQATIQRSADAMQAMAKGTFQ